MTEIRVPVSFGELIDKLTILEIKSERIADPAKLVNVQRELDALATSWNQAPEASADIAQLRTGLKAVNERLWQIEDEIRLKEAAQEFDTGFITLARSVYFENDERARLKREINRVLGSSLVEEKSYQPYGSRPDQV